VEVGLEVPVAAEWVVPVAVEWVEPVAVVALAELVVAAGVVADLLSLLLPALPLLCVLVRLPLLFLLWPRLLWLLRLLLSWLL